MRKITSHIHSAADSQLVLEAVDERGAGNANHHYRVSGFDAKSNPAFGDPFWNPA
jgi:hypothetical protein